MRLLIFSEPEKNRFLFVSLSLVLLPSSFFTSESFPRGSASRSP